MLHDLLSLLYMSAMKTYVAANTLNACIYKGPTTCCDIHATTQNHSCDSWATTQKQSLLVCHQGLRTLCAVLAQTCTTPLIHELSYSQQRSMHRAKLATQRFLRKYGTGIAALQIHATSCSCLCRFIQPQTSTSRRPLNCTAHTCQSSCTSLQKYLQYLGDQIDNKEQLAHTRYL